MIKKILASTLAGALALPLIFGGHAEAAPKPELKPVTVAFAGMSNPCNLNNGQTPDLQGMFKQFGIKLDPSQLQPAVQQPAPQQSKGQQAQPTTPKKPAASSNSGSSPKQTSNSQMNAFEKKVVDLTNQERTKAGLKPLKSDNAALSKMARDKSTDMRDKNYFDHQSPTYGSPFDMMKKYGISYSSAGENIAAGQKTPEEVVQGWMNSPGHRANILNANFTTIGVGYVSGGSYGSYWTQEFIGK